MSDRPSVAAPRPGPPERIDLCPGAWLDFWPSAVPAHEAWLTRLLGELPLAADYVHIAGRMIPAPRLVSWHGDPGTDYVYSGVRHRAADWLPGLSELRARIEAMSGLRFNAVLANYYRDGADGMGWHADAEPEIGPSPDDRWIGSLSLGAPRRFLLRHRNGRDRREIELGRGSLLVMRGTTQTHYHHSAPKTARAIGPRLNLTFRHILPAPERAAIDLASG